MHSWDALAQLTSAKTVGAQSLLKKQDKMLYGFLTNDRGRCRLRPFFNVDYLSEFRFCLCVREDSADFKPAHNSF